MLAQSLGGEVFVEALEATMWYEQSFQMTRHRLHSASSPSRRQNMAFVHFVTVAKYYKLVSDKEMEPMQPLIDLFIKQQRIPPEAVGGGHWAQQNAAN